MRSLKKDLERWHTTKLDVADKDSPGITWTSAPGHLYHTEVLCMDLFCTLPKGGVVHPEVCCSTTVEAVVGWDHDQDQAGTKNLEISLRKLLTLVIVPVCRQQASPALLAPSP